MSLSTPETLFDADAFEPLTVKSIGCAACIGNGCPRCGFHGRLGSSIWRGRSYLAHVTCLIDEAASTKGQGR